MADEAVVMIEDPPAPDLADVQQRELTALPTVPVRIEGPVRNQNLPARAGPAFAFPLKATGQAEQVLGQDWRRSKATLVSTAIWHYKSGLSKENVPIPANVPLVITHCDAVWARVPTGTADLSVIVEIFAD